MILDNIFFSMTIPHCQINWDEYLYLNNLLSLVHQFHLFILYAE